MAEDDAGLRILISQRKCRPSFSRMISWEIPQENDMVTSVSHCRKKSKSQFQNVPHKAFENENGDTCSNKKKEDFSCGDTCSDEEKDNSISDSEESEYYSAEESLLFDESDSKNSTEVSLEDETDGLSVFTSDGSQAISGIYTDSTLYLDDRASINTESDILKSFETFPTSGRRRAPSKKQKKKKRDKNKIFYADYEVPFRNVEDIDFNVADLLQISSESLLFEKTVPSLLELSVKALRSRWMTCGRVSVAALPSTLKNVVSDCKRGHSFASMQLSWFYRLLGYAEKLTNLKQNFLKEHKEKDVDDKEIISYFVCLEKRNVWNCRYFETEDTDYVGCKISSWLPYTYLANRHLNQKKWPHPVCLLSVLASVIDLMLPCHIPDRRLQKSKLDCVTESSVLNKALSSFILCVKASLEKRYPNVVKYFFDKSVPYACWARGNIKMAAELFLNLAKQSKDTERAMYLSEVARLYSQQEETDIAKRLYMEAADAVIDWGNTLYELEVRGQRFLLMADVYDHGPMTSLKSNLAAEAWKGSLQFLKKTHPSSSVRAVESFLCFHSRSDQKDGSSVSHLEKGRDLIESQTEWCPNLYLHLSMVYAMLGRSDQSLQAYHNFLHKLSNPAGPGHQFMPSGTSRRYYNPWEPLLDLVKHSGTPKLLNAIWRTQLGHMRIVSGIESFEGDLQATSDLKLQLTPEGYLSADIQMVLPPIRALNLDPYTGLHVFQQTSGLTRPWHSLSSSENSDHTYNVGLLAPTLVQIYQDQSGNSVHLLCPDSEMITRKYHLTKGMTLHWSGSDGQRAKVNLMQHMKCVIKQHLEFVLEYDAKNSSTMRCLSEIYNDMDMWLQEAKEALQYCFDHGWDMNYATTVSKVMNGLNKIKEQKSEKGKVKVKTSVKGRNRKGKYQPPQQTKVKCPYQPELYGEPPDFGIDILDYCTCDKTICFFLKSTSRFSYIVFVDCSSKETFLHPKVTVINMLQTEFTLSHGTVSHHMPRADVIWLSYNKYDIKQNLLNKPTYHIYGKHGELLKTESVPDELYTGTSPVYINTTHILGNKLYGIAECKTRVKCDRITEDPVFSQIFPEIAEMYIMANKILVQTGDALYILDPDSLQVLPITMKATRPSLAIKDHNCIAAGASKVSVLQEKTVAAEDKNITRIGVAINNHLLVFDLSDSIELILCTALPGMAKDICFVSIHVGLLVSATLHDNSSTDFYREHIYHLSYSGDLLGVLPFLGPGLRCFYPVLLPGNSEAAARDPALGKPGWYVFFRDGHEGIMGMWLGYV